MRESALSSRIPAPPGASLDSQGSPMVLDFRSGTPFDADEQRSLEDLAAAVAACGHPQRPALLAELRRTIERVDGLAAALDCWPRLGENGALGERRRNLATLVEGLRAASDATLDMFLPTQALLSRALLMAELNAWRHMSHVAAECLAADPRGPALREQVDHWVRTCVYARLTDELLLSISIDDQMPLPVREGAVADLVQLWQERQKARLAPFFRLLAAIWEARRRIRVSQGALLGVSEMFRLLQVGCHPEFMAYFSRPLCTEDESAAFREFLIGVPTEQIRSLEQYMAQSGKSALAPEEAARVLALETAAADRHPALAAFEFFRERHLQAAARRRSGAPGPKKTAEEYALIYYLQPPAR